jgi:hypothetical protein
MDTNVEAVVAVKAIMAVKQEFADDNHNVSIIENVGTAKYVQLELAKALVCNRAVALNKVLR